MTSIEYRAAIALLKKIRKPKFSIETFCFKEQIDFIQDNRQFKTAVCSRRSGKTIACAADLLDTAIKHDNVVCLYTTLKRVNAKRIIWPELLRINTEYSLGGIPNDTELSLRMPNRSVIYATGAKDRSEIENFRGLALKKVYIDESQAFKQYIAELIDDVISKALFDYAGQLCLIGTPSMVPAGYFYECAHSSAWSHHAWTMFNNPYLERKSGKPVLQLVLDDCARMGVGIDHPKIQRECYGRWVTDLDFLVFKYNAEKNHYDYVDYSRDWEFVIGVDLGFDDADALSVIGWHKHQKIAYLIKEEVKAKQGITELSKQIESLVEEFSPLKVVMDQGGLGKKIAEEMRKRFQIPVVAAEKHRKFEFIEILNDAMRTSRFFAKKDGIFAQDCMLVEWDRDITNPDKLKISESFHSDICFVAGTLIETNLGQKPIEQVIVGDLVMTRDGLRPVLAAAMTRENAYVIEVKFSNGSSLVCTPKHPIYTSNRGFISADALLYADRCVISRKWQQDQQSFKLKLSNLMGQDLLDIQTHVGSLIKTIIAATSAMVEGLGRRPLYIEQFGSLASEKSQTGTTFITETGTHSTTTSQTWNAFHPRSTIRNTCKTELDGASLLGVRNTSKKSEKWQKNGIDPTMGINGTLSMPNPGQKSLGQKLRIYVQYVGSGIYAILYRLVSCFIAQTNVVQRLAEILAKTMRGVYANFARLVLRLIGSQKSDSVAVLAQLQTPIGFASVYNLTVAGKHEYFANGILVSNCDATLYAFREALHWLSEDAPVKIIPLSNEWYNKQVKEMEEQALKRLEEDQNDLWSDM